MEKNRKIITILVIIAIILGVLFLLVKLKSGGVIHSDTGTFRIPSWGNGAPPLTITLTPEFAMKKHKGSDFDIYYFYNEEKDSAIGIYLGHNPGLFSNNINRTESTNVFKNNKVIWYTWEEEVGNNIKINRETIVDDFFPDEHTDYKGLMIHVFLKGNTIEEVDMLQNYVESLKILE